MEADAYIKSITAKKKTRQVLYRSLFGFSHVLMYSLLTSKHSR